MLCASLQACAYNSAWLRSQRSSDGSAALGGVLRVSSENPRYFTDNRGRPIYLTGSHTWSNLIDRGPTDPPLRFDFNRYLDFLQNSNHNFIRLWGRHVTRYSRYGRDILYAEPLPWVRSGPGTALDGKPRFDLRRFDASYFARLRNRVTAAGERGICVAIMLFGGNVEVSEWEGNPFNIANNINGVDGDMNGDGKGDTHQLPLSDTIDLLQKAYVRRVIDAVNDLDNVIFEVSNEDEPDSLEWQSQIANYIRTYESGGADGIVRKQHMVGITAFSTTDNAALSRSDADWIAPGAMPFDSQADTYIDDPPAADGHKVSILDSDHLFFNLMFNNPAAARMWVWKSFTRGHNPILMENIFQDTTGRAVPPTLHDPGFKAAREAMGYTRRFANMIDLSSMLPRGDLTSTGYMLASHGSEYIVYQPASEPFTVEIVGGNYSYEWFDPASGRIHSSGLVTVADGQKSYTPPFPGDAVLYLKNTQRRDRR